MSTIQQLIEGYANIYRGDSTNFEPMLTEKDFLADIAKQKAIASCAADLRCAFQKLERYRESPDEFLAEYVGSKGSTVRLLYERQAGEMLRIAQKYRSSMDEDFKGHPFHKEMETVEEKYVRCLHSRGIVEYLSMRPVHLMSMGVFMRRLYACTAVRDGEGTGFKPYRQPDHGRSLWR